VYYVSCLSFDCAFKGVVLSLGINENCQVSIPDSFFSTTIIRLVEMSHHAVQPVYNRMLICVKNDG
jgi:uncharacterized protein YciU (UPF0263 family)